MFLLPGSWQKFLYKWTSSSQKVWKHWVFKSQSLYESARSNISTCFFIFLHIFDILLHIFHICLHIFHIFLHIFDIFLHILGIFLHIVYIKEFPNVTSSGGECTRESWLYTPGGPGLEIFPSPPDIFLNVTSSGGWGCTRASWIYPLGGA